MIREIQEAMDHLQDLKKFIKNYEIERLRLQDKITAQHETIHHLQEGIKRRDEIIQNLNFSIQELNDRIETLRRI